MRSFVLLALLMAGTAVRAQEPRRPHQSGQGHLHHDRFFAFSEPDGHQGNRGSEGARAVLELDLLSCSPGAFEVGTHTAQEGTAACHQRNRKRGVLDG